MAFTGLAVIKKISDKQFRITGLSLGAAQTGTIGFSDKTIPANVSLVAPEWGPYRNGSNELVRLQDSVQVRMTPTTDVDVVVPVVVTKTGIDHGDFVITLANTEPAEGEPTASLEIVVEFH